MTSNPNKTPLPRWDLCLIAALFLPACFLYLWRTFQTHLIYTAFGDLIDFPIFAPGRDLLLQRLASPGGLVKYTADFLSQGFYYNAVGALILTALAFAFYLTTFLLLKTATKVRSHVCAAIPAIAVVALYGDYNHHLVPLLALLMSVAFSAALAAGRPRSDIAALVLFAAAFLLLYWAAAAASLLFAVLIALAELLRRRWRLALADIVLAAASAYLTGAFLFLLEMPRPFTAGLPIFSAATLGTLSIAHLWLFFPAAVIVAAAGRYVFRTASSVPEKPAAVRRPRKRARHSETTRRARLHPIPIWLKTGIAIFIIAPAAVFAIRHTHDPNRKHMLHMLDLLRNRQWQAYVDAAKTFHRRGFWNFQINHDTNRALCHAGTLLDEMFSFDQEGVALMLITANPMRSTTKYLRVSDLFFEMGNLNDAEQWAYELLETEGPSPLILERLVDINIAKNQPAAASVFLNVLAEDLVHGPRARERLHRLTSDAAMTSDTRIRNARDMSWRTHRVLNYQNPERLLLDLLDQHPDNRMAFEYLMAIYLLMHDQEKIAANLHRLDTLGYDRIPCHIEEAIMIYADKTGRPVNLHGRQISPATIQRHRRYLEVFTKMGKNKDATIGALAPGFGNSYFFFSMFDKSGVGR
ncbi:MAG: hypothetical protein IH624_15765 [Phycisphaerae bacterium]|nr:hypothetical protein [Phycisphaerae bacterium]